MIRSPEVCAYIRKNPELSAKQIASHFHIAASRVHTLAAENALKIRRVNTDEKTLAKQIRFIKENGHVMNLQELGKALKISYVRVFSIARRHGLKTRSIRLDEKAKEARIRFLETHPELTRREMAAKTETKLSTIDALIRTHDLRYFSEKKGEISQASTYKKRVKDNVEVPTETAKKSQFLSLKW